MPDQNANSDALPQEVYDGRKEVYDLRQHALQLRVQFAMATSNAVLDQLGQQLQEVEGQLSAAEKKLWEAESRATELGLIVNTKIRSNLLGPGTTGLDVKVKLRMAYVPTGIYHLLDAKTRPLVSCDVRNADPNNARRLRVSSYIEGYSATAVETVELNKGDKRTLDQLPTLFPGSIRRLNEMTRATLNVLVEDLDGKIELHRTHPIWLLARNTAPLELKDPNQGELVDMTPYLGAFVTPNAPSIMEFLRKAAERHPDKQLVGYQGDVISQVRAIFDTLKQDAQITYVNSLIAFDPTEGSSSQRVRLPRESLRERQANCIDGTLLFASLLEAISLNAALVILPGHALVAWEDPKDSKQWSYLETVEIGTNTFDEARDHGKRRAAIYEKLFVDTKDDRQFRRWSIRELRISKGITPLE